jgi:hypothetical protein
MKATFWKEENRHNLHPDILKFWDGDGISFFEQECYFPAGDPKYPGGSYRHTCYCRSLGGTYDVIATTKVHLGEDKTITHKYVNFYYPIGNWRLQKREVYTEKQMLSLVKLKAFL